MKTLNIWSYTNYQNFLLAYSQECRKRNPKWTFGVWAKQLQLKDTSSITKIVNGQRHPGNCIVNKLTAYFKFSPKQKSYFEDLIRIQKYASDPRLSAVLLQKMEKNYPNSQMRVLDLKQFKLISHWYCLAIREMVRLPEFKEDYGWIANQLNFKLTQVEIRKTIELLLDLNLIIRKGNGDICISEDGRIHTPNDIASEAIKRYHEQILENAKLALRSLGVDEREYSASCFNMRKENLQKAKEIIREFKSNFVKLLEEDDADGVYQIQLQFYPLTKSN